MATVLHDKVLLLGFKVSDKDPSGGGLIMELPDALHQNVKKYLGDAFPNDRYSKYSRHKHILEIDGHPIRMYMSYGVWRFGSRRLPDHAMDQLRKLAFLLEE